MARERRVENLLVGAVEGIGGACDKHVNPGYRGDPDRLCSFPWGYHCMVETKWATGEVPEDHQLRRHIYWRERGIDVWVACDGTDIERIISFALGAKALSVYRDPLLTQSASRDVSRRPRIGEDRDSVQRVGRSKASRIKLLSGLGPGT